MVTREALLHRLPPIDYRNKLLVTDQAVGDIVNEILSAHRLYTTHYDKIAGMFTATGAKLYEALFIFLKNNISYRQESKEKQTSKTPARLIVSGIGDCKHYALFIGGVLDAVSRVREKIDWTFRFAGYGGKKEPGHVFVVARENGREYWIDPVLNYFNQRDIIPTFFIDKKPIMALYRLSGIEDFEVIEDTSVTDPSLTPDVEQAIRLLLQYGVLNAEGKVNDSLLLSLQSKMPVDEFVKLANARKLLQTASMSGLFDSIWYGVKKVTLSIPRNAYLSIVGLNVFGTATKLKRVIDDPDGRKKLADKWKSLGGTFSKLENTIKDGAKKKAILGAVPDQPTIGNPAVPAWVATASAIIAAIAPIIKSVLSKLPPEPGTTDQYPYGVCPDGITPRNADGTCPSAADSGGFLKQNAPLLIGGALVVFLLLSKKKRAS